MCGPGGGGDGGDAAAIAAADAPVSGLGLADPSGTVSNPANAPGDDPSADPGTPPPSLGENPSLGLDNPDPSHFSIDIPDQPPFQADFPPFDQALFGLPPIVSTIASMPSIASGLGAVGNAIGNAATAIGNAMGGSGATGGPGSDAGAIGQGGGAAAVGGNSAAGEPSGPGGPGPGDAGGPGGGTGPGPGGPSDVTPPPNPAVADTTPAAAPAATGSANTTSLSALLESLLKNSVGDADAQRRIDQRTQDLLYNGGQGAPLTGAEEGQAQAALKDFHAQQRSNDIQNQLADMQLAAIKQGGRATPEQIALIDEQTAAAQAGGESDIKRFLLETQRQINDETAQAAGLRPTDTPVMRLSERAGEEAARQQGQLTLGLRKANADSRLNYPLAAQKVNTATADSSGNLNQAAADFRAQLQQQAVNNRFRLGQQPITNSLAFAGRPISNQQPQSLASQLAGWGALAGGVGSAASSWAKFSDWLKTQDSNSGTVDTTAATDTNTGDNWWDLPDWTG